MKDSFQINSDDYTLLKAEIERFNEVVEGMKIPKMYKIKVVVFSTVFVIANYLSFGFVTLNYLATSWNSETRLLFVIISLVICFLSWLFMNNEFESNSSDLQTLIRSRKDYTTIDIINFLKKHCSEENSTSEEIWNKILDILNNKNNDGVKYEQKDKDIAKFIVYNFNTKII